MNFEDDIHYKLDKVLSYNAYLNFLIGERGVGKTFSVTKFVINDFIKHNNQFFYIRRFKKELAEAKPKFFSAIKQKNVFNNNLINKNNQFFCDDKICGFAYALSNSQDLKSSNFDNVKNVIFDEFLIEEGQKKYYLKNEAFVFLNLLETIGRLRDIRVFFLGNATNLLNPYFTYFNINTGFNTEFATFKNGLILVNYIKNIKYREAKKQTRFGELIANTSYSDYAIDNNFINNIDNNFIAKKTSKSKCYFNFIYQNFTLGVWKDYDTSLYYISNNWNNGYRTFATTLNDHSPNTLFLKSARSYLCWKNLVEAFKIGNVRFENSRIANISNSLFTNILF